MRHDLRFPRLRTASPPVPTRPRPSAGSPRPGVRRRAAPWRRRPTPLRTGRPPQPWALRRKGRPPLAISAGPRVQQRRHGQGGTDGRRPHRAAALVVRIAPDGRLPGEQGAVRLWDVLQGSPSASCAQREGARASGRQVASEVTARLGSGPGARSNEPEGGRRTSPAWRTQGTDQQRRRAAKVEPDRCARRGLACLTPFSTARYRRSPRHARRRAITSWTRQRRLSCSARSPWRRQARAASRQRRAATFGGRTTGGSSRGSALLLTRTEIGEDLQQPQRAGAGQECDRHRMGTSPRTCRRLFRSPRRRPDRRRSRGDRPRARLGATEFQAALGVEPSRINAPGPSGDLFRNGIAGIGAGHARQRRSVTVASQEVVGVVRASSHDRLCAGYLERQS